MIYFASKVKWAHKWRALREAGIPINSTWIDEVRNKQSLSLPDLWTRCVNEAKSAKAVILFVETGEILKGALVEVGAALGNGVRVLVVGEVDGSWVNHPLCTKCGSVNDALELVRFIFCGEW